MRTQQITIYKFSELPEPLKEKALEKFRHNYEWAWTDEWNDTLTEFCKTYYCKTTKWEVSAYSHSYCYGEIKGENLEGEELTEFLQARYKESLTGYCGDYDIQEPIKKYLEKPYATNLETIIKECFESLATAYQKDIESQLEDAYLIDHIEANNYEFLENGEMI